MNSLNSSRQVTFKSDLHSPPGMSRANAFIFDTATLTVAPRCYVKPPARLIKSPNGRLFGCSSNQMTRIFSSPGSKPPSTEDVSSVLKDFSSEKLLKDVQKRWDDVEDKTSLVIYVVGAFLLLFVGSSVVSAFDRLPLLPRLFQLVGLVYTAWFVYRYLLFKSSRQELISDVEELKNKISGGKKDA